MIQYTVLNDQNVRAIMATYNLGELLSFKILSGRSENTNYLVITEIGKYVLTICEQKSAETTIELADLLEYLDHPNFSTLKIILNVTNKTVGL
ncbi:protein kinase family protein [Maribacter antarcticus]|uniref:hypothetical protein n=1 Tax=Maribacter antarcticus TaxID=505250 RepID=UPI00047C04E9|nr:hypothetical protein [Maribacter antarcticus]